MNDATGTASERTEQEPAIPTSQQVADYLVRHPDFLEINSYLLTELTVKHQSGQSISLVERQVSALREENRQLKQQLGTLIHNAKQNDQLLEKTKALILKLLGCKSNPEIQTQIESVLIVEFGSSACKLWLLKDEASTGQLSYCAANKELTRFIEKDYAYCGLLHEQEKQLLFAEHATQVGSAAVLSLRNGIQPIALLAIGNTDKNHYRDNMSTSLLDYIGQVTAELLVKD
jgi:uncharacterized protein YigA (DUF484 family)